MAGKSSFNQPYKGECQWMLPVADRVDVLPNTHNYICRYTINSYQLSRLYSRQKTHTCQVRGTRSGAGCSVKPQIVWPHILPRCSTLAQSKKLSQHVSALKVRFSEGGKAHTAIFQRLFCVVTTFLSLSIICLFLNLIINTKSRFSL